MQNGTDKGPHAVARRAESSRVPMAHTTSNKHGHKSNAFGIGVDEIAQAKMASSME